MDMPTPLRAVAAVTGLCAALTLAGCAANAEYTAASEPEIARAQLAIEQAQANKGDQYAGSELTRARDKLAAAQSAQSRGETERAERLAAEAAVEAQLAEATAEAAQAEATATEIQKTLARLREEVSRVRQAQ